MTELPGDLTAVIVHTGRLAEGAPSPRDRQLLRRVLDLATSSAIPITLLCTEPVLGSAVSPELDAAGVRVVEAVARVDAWLGVRSSSVAWILATDVSRARRAMLAAPDVPLVIDLAELPSALHARTAVAVGALEQAGLATLLARARQIEAAVCRHAALVICGDRETADAVNDIATAARVAIVAPSVPRADRFASPRERAGVAVVGRFADEPGLPDEELLERLTRQLDVPVHAVGTDVAITRRAMRSAVASAARVDDLERALRARRVTVVSRDHGPLAAELAGLGLPAVVVDDRDRSLGAVKTLLYDDEAWTAAHAAQHTRALEYDPARQGAQYRAALRVAGIEIGDPNPVAPAASRSATYRVPSRAGTLAAVTDASEAARAEAQPAGLLPWEHALYANLDLPPDVAWRRWLAVHHDVAAQRGVLVARAARASHRPLISVVMPVHQTDPRLLRAAIASVSEQIYDRWELCIADDGTRRADTRAVLDAAAAGDPRVKRARLADPGGIAAATNVALALASGTYVAFLDHDDVLSADALEQVVRHLEVDPGVDVLYSDEDKLDEHGQRVEPFCKPDWSPDFLLSCNYITHLLVVRRSSLELVGGLRAQVDGAQDYDLLLRLTEVTDRIAHIAAPLYSWRKSPASTAANIAAKPAAHASSRRALSDALARRDVDAIVEPGRDPTWHRVRYRIASRPTVTVIIPTRDRVDLLEPCVDLVRATAHHEPLEILVVDNESTDTATLRYLDAFDGRVVRYPHRFNYARQMNLASIEAKGEVLLLLNNDARPASEGWFDALLEHAMRPEVGAVGARLRFPDGKPQHEGIVLNAGGVALNLDSGNHAVFGDNIRNVAAVTGACLMMRTSVWHAVGGMDEQLRVAYNDVDLCLRVGERGWRVIYTPVAELRHAESSSRGSLHPEVDEAYYQRRWGPPRTAADPFFTTAIELLAPFSPRL